MFKHTSACENTSKVIAFYASFTEPLFKINNSLVSVAIKSVGK